MLPFCNGKCWKFVGNLLFQPLEKCWKLQFPTVGKVFFQPLENAFSNRWKYQFPTVRKVLEKCWKNVGTRKFQGLELRSSKGWKNVGKFQFQKLKKNSWILNKKVFNFVTKQFEVDLTKFSELLFDLFDWIDVHVIRAENLLRKCIQNERTVCNYSLLFLETVIKTLFLCI